VPIRAQKLVSVGGAFCLLPLQSCVRILLGGCVCELCLGLYFVSRGRATLRVNLLPPSSLLEAWGSRFHRNVDTFLPDYTASRTSRQYFSCSPPRESELSGAVQSSWIQQPYASFAPVCLSVCRSIIAPAVWHISSYFLDDMATINRSLQHTDCHKYVAVRRSKSAWQLPAVEPGSVCSSDRAAQDSTGRIPPYCYTSPPTIPRFFPFNLFTRI